MAYVYRTASLTDVTYIVSAMVAGVTVHTRMVLTCAMWEVFLYGPADEAVLFCATVVVVGFAWVDHLHQFPGFEVDQRNLCGGSLVMFNNDLLHCLGTFV